jgi:hypothetical protein
MTIFLDDLALRDMSARDLEALNQATGIEIDAIQAYRRRITIAYDEKIRQDAIYQAIQHLPGGSEVLQLIEAGRQSQSVTVNVNPLGIESSVLTPGT